MDKESFGANISDRINTSEGRSFPFFAIPGENENQAYYHPILNFLHLPKTGGSPALTLNLILETGHWIPPTFTSRCFLRTVATLVHTEFYRTGKDGNFNFNQVKTDNNPLNWLLKEIFNLVNNKLRIIEEIDALDFAYLDLLQEGEVQQAHNLRDKILDKLNNEFAEFEELYWLYSEADDLPLLSESPRETLFGFAMGGPGYLPPLPLNTEGYLDSSQITKAQAKELLEDFKNKYQELPYSPLKRFSLGAEILPKIAKESDLEKSDYSLMDKLKIRANLEYSYRNNGKLCNFCPLELLKRQEINLLEIDGENLLTRNCPLNFRPGDMRNIIPWEFLIIEIMDETIIQRLPSYLSGWPKTASFAALEYLRHIVFYSQEEKDFSSISLIEKVPQREKEILSDLGGNVYSLLNQNKSSESILPFLSVQLEEKQSGYPEMDIVLSKD